MYDGKPRNLFGCLSTNDRANVFPNINFALLISLTTQVTVESSRRPFSELRLMIIKKEREANNAARATYVNKLLIIWQYYEQNGQKLEILIQRQL